MSWALVLLAPAEELEIRAAELFELGASGVEMQEPGMLLMPGTPALPEGMSRAIAHFHERAAADRAAAELRSEALIEVPAKDWSIAWRAHHRSIRLASDLFIVPPWENAPAGSKSVIIEPGMAFGTGSHPTTLLCLERLRELLLSRRSADVLDIGTGSGIIALLAHLLGAGRVCATENDPAALRAARGNGDLNRAERIEWRLAEDPSQVSGRFEIVVANILLDALEELAERIASKVAPGGRLLLSGLLADQADAAERAYTAQGLRALERRRREEWALVELEQPEERAAPATGGGRRPEHW
jgi:ribosomal protein L11 methyltransferase